MDTDNDLNNYLYKIFYKSTKIGIYMMVNDFISEIKSYYPASKIYNMSMNEFESFAHMIYNEKKEYN